MHPYHFKTIYLQYTPKKFSIFSKKKMIICYQCSKLFALPTCSVRKTGEITDGVCILLPCIRKTGETTDCQNNPASAPSDPHKAPALETKAVMAAMMNLYFPRIRRMKLPEMPGRIIAQMAMAPAMNTNQRASGVRVGESVHTTIPSTIPSTRKSPSG